MNIPERTKGSIEGLENMVKFLNTKHKLNKMIMVEVGSWVGTSAKVFSKYFKHVICIDPFLPFKNTITAKYSMDTVYKVFLKNIEPYKNITHVKHTSTDFLNELGEAKKDMVIYIDGNHNYEPVKEDIINALKCGFRIITGHDYCKKFPGVIKAVNQCLGQPDRTFKDTSWVWENN